MSVLRYSCMIIKNIKYISPVKTSKQNHQYFSLEFETDTIVKKPVCFSPSKRPGIESLALNKSGCVISNAWTKNDALMISEYSTVEELMNCHCT